MIVYATDRAVQKGGGGGGVWGIKKSVFLVIVVVVLKVFIGNSKGIICENLK